MLNSNDPAEHVFSLYNFQRHFEEKFIAPFIVKFPVMLYQIGLNFTKCIFHFGKC